MRRSTYLVALTILGSVATFVIFMPLSSNRFSRLSSADTVLGFRTKSVDCRVRRSFPDPDCTPGAVADRLITADICRPDFAPASAVSAGLANQVFLQYGIYAPQPGQYQIDHLIGETLGGSNDISNLWPQSAEPRPGFWEKDRVEAYLHREVCAGRLSLAAAREQIVSDWLKIFLVLPSSP